MGTKGHLTSQLLMLPNCWHMSFTSLDIVACDTLTFLTSSDIAACDTLIFSMALWSAATSTVSVQVSGPSLMSELLVMFKSPVLGLEKDQGPNQTATDCNRNSVSVAISCGQSRSRLPLTGLG